MISEEKVKEYVDSKGLSCPYCGSGDLIGGSVTVDAGHATQEVQCGLCGRSWDDVYTLTGLEVVS